MLFVDVASYNGQHPSEYMAYLRHWGTSHIAERADTTQPLIYVTSLPQLHSGEDYWGRLRQFFATVAAEQLQRSALVLDYGHEGAARSPQVLAQCWEIAGRVQALGFSLPRVCMLQHNQRLLHAPLPFLTLEMNTWLAGQGQLPSTLSAGGVPECKSLPLYVSRQRRFIMLNYWPRFHRVFALLYLLRHNLLDLGFVSFPGFRIPESNVDFLEDAQQHADLNLNGELLYYAERLQQACPLIVDRPLARKCTNEGHMETAQTAQEAFQQSYLSLVTETGFGDGQDELRITEKSLKPIYWGQPFLLLGSPGCLGLLRSFGFQTFQPHWAEDYDEVTEPGRRFALVMHTLRRLLELPDMSWRTQYWPQLFRLAGDNRRHFHNGFRQCCRERFVDAILPRLQRLAE